jgi:hypothetical protein
MPNFSASRTAEHLAILDPINAERQQSLVGM